MLPLHSGLSSAIIKAAKLFITKKIYEREHTGFLCVHHTYLQQLPQLFVYLLGVLDLLPQPVNFGVAVAIVSLARLLFLHLH